MGFTIHSCITAVPLIGSGFREAPTTTNHCSTLIPSTFSPHAGRASSRQRRVCLLRGGKVQELGRGGGLHALRCWRNHASPGEQQQHRLLHAPCTIGVTRGFDGLWPGLGWCAQVLGRQPVRLGRRRHHHHAHHAGSAPRAVGPSFKLRRPVCLHAGARSHCLSEWLMWSCWCEGRSTWWA